MDDAPRPVDPRGLGGAWAEVLGLTPTRRGLTGTLNGFRYRISGGILWCSHRRRLRLGLAVQPIPGTVKDAFPSLPYLDLGSTGIGASVRARAAEAATARAILLDLQNDFAPLLDLLPSIFIDDRWIGVGLIFSMGAAPPPAWVAGELAHLSTRILAVRDEWEASFETAIEPAWSRVADTLSLTWNPDRSRIRGELHGARIEARIDAAALHLYTKVFVDWPSLERALSITRRGGAALVVSQEDDAEDAAREAFHRGLEASEDDLPPMVMAAAVQIARTGASLEVDDTGLVACIDRVVDDEATVSALLVGAIRLTTALIAPEAEPRGAYR